MTTNAAPATIEDVEAVTDLTDRMVAAHDLAMRSDAAEPGLREQRDLVAAVATDRGIKPVDVYAPAGVSRGMYARAAKSGPSKAERKRRVAANPDAFADLPAALRCAVAAHETSRKVYADAIRLRDNTAVALMERRADPVSNSTIAALLGISTARVAQIRKRGHIDA